MNTKNNIALDCMKTLADTYYIEGNYNSAIELYTNILNKNSGDLYVENKDYANKILSNRCSAYIKNKNYSEGLQDAIKLIETNNLSSKSWGQLGAVLYNLKKHDKSLFAYNKANELSPNIVYELMINKLNEKLNKKQNEKQVIDESPLNVDYLTNHKNIYDNIMSDPTKQAYMTDILNKIMNRQVLDKFMSHKALNKILSHKMNHLDILKDDDIKSFISDFLSIITQ